MGTKHLTEADRLRARTLFFDAGLPKARICQITGFSLNQVKLAIREKTPKTRSGRPPRRRPGAASAAAASGMAGETPVGVAQGAEDQAIVDGHNGHGEQGDASALGLAHLSAPAPPPVVDDVAADATNAARRSDDHMPSLHHYGQQQQQQQQHQQQDSLHHGHHTVKWEPGYHQQAPYYSSWTQPVPGSPNSAIGGHRGSATPASPTLPLPTTSGRMLPTVAPLGIPSPYSSTNSRGDGSVSGSVSGRDGRSSDSHDVSSSTSSSSLASSATSYSSMSSSASGGGFSLPSILASAMGP
ncbi:uncharacterized protein SPSK_05483 [Sporothrix schenckii 1099-18]|uniref:Uncharacterized protein n=2 Tax=Sporothrix schenckii TaxID=29908 RepID=U7Q4S3_SPOS1|nr:uncharacterized protein SPSK_05483 [Sporothrix schenckii 1099-18]ERT02187.1 hypothetical protein HMPREF1624_00485 [Sporothrix schenckii ATCC 58251]KJR80597.1 hypothetical protein SPSK_05483 [Sporothrix schenckii 1099-18]